MRRRRVSPAVEAREKLLRESRPSKRASMVALSVNLLFGLLVGAGIRWGISSNITALVIISITTCISLGIYITFKINSRTYYLWQLFQEDWLRVIQENELTTI